MSQGAYSHQPEKITGLDYLHDIGVAHAVFSRRTHIPKRD